MRFRPVRAKTIVASLALLSVVGWRVWITPRIDCRLVGRWECTTPLPERPFVTLYLRGDGSGAYAWQDNGTAHVEAYPWALSGSTLQVHVHLQSSSSRAFERFIDSVIFAFERPRVAASCESWKVLSVTRDELRLRQRSDSVVMTFCRIPSGLDP